MDLGVLENISFQLEAVSKDARLKLDKLLNNNDIDKNKVLELKEIYSKIETSLQNKDISTLQSILEDANKINI
jgi:uncharacterized protein YfkK (UPF0435 family)